MTTQAQAPDDAEAGAAQQQQPEDDVLLTPDPDAQRLADAEADLKKEEEDAQTQQQDDDPAVAADAAQALPTQDQQTQQQPGQQAAPQGGQRGQQGIPPARLREQTEKTRRLALSAAYYKGAYEAAQQFIQRGMMPADGQPNGQGGGQQQTREPTPDEQINAARLERATLLQKFQDGEIDAKAYAAQIDNIEDRIFAAQQKKLAPASPQATPQRVTLTMEQRMQDILSRYPAARQASVDDLRPYQPIAERILANRGRPYDRNSEASVLELREEVARLYNRDFGDGQDHPAAAHGQPAPAGNGAARPNGQQQPGQQQPQRQNGVAAGTGTHATPAQVQTKLETRAAQPPHLAQVGTTGQGSEGITAESILGMSEEELLALPPSLLARIEAGQEAGF